MLNDSKNLASDMTSNHDREGDVETALLDAELFLKYHAPDRAIKRLRTALESSPRSIALRERLRELSRAKYPEEAARQCLALASLYIEREDYQTAHDRLLEAKQLNARINIAPGLDAIRRARQSKIAPSEQAVEPRTVQKQTSTLSGDLSAISIFDAAQVIENSRLSGALTINNSVRSGRIFFNEGQIIGAETNDATGEDAFRRLIEATDGTFDFEKSAEMFPVNINATSNTNLILDSLRQLDEEKK